MFAAASRPESLSVIDPCNRTGKITVPFALVTETRGVTDFLKYTPANPPPPDMKDLSLCLLFQKGRCNAGGRCNQVHVGPDFIQDVRSRALAGRTCCARHGDVNSTALNEPRTVAVHAEREITYYSLADFAATPSLDLAISRSRTSTVRVQANRICRLHQRGSCKFGRDCKNIHLCSSAKPASAPPASSAKRDTAVNRSRDPRLDGAAFRHDAAAAAPRTEPPALGLAFRAVDVSDRCQHPADVSSGSSAAFVAPSARSASEDSGHESIFGADTSAGFGFGVGNASTVKPMSILSIMSEFNTNSGVRHHPAGSGAVDEELDPLDIIENSSTASAASAVGDLNAFVDALVQCGDAEPMASPQWLSA